ncbi:leucine zipper domain-containing protein [Rhodovulum sulfidophilum]
MAQAFGVSVRGRKWRARLRERGPAALQNRSSAPHRVSARLP